MSERDDAAYTRTVRRYWNRPLGSKLIILGAIAFLASMLGPWTRVCVATADVGARKCGWDAGPRGHGARRGAHVRLDDRLRGLGLRDLRRALRRRDSRVRAPARPLAEALDAGLAHGGDHGDPRRWPRALHAGQADRGQRVPDTLGLGRLRDRAVRDARGPSPRPAPVGHPGPRRRAASGRLAVESRPARRLSRARAARRGYPVGTTYGGDQVSTWSVLRSSSEPRSPVGLV